MANFGSEAHEKNWSLSELSYFYMLGRSILIHHPAKTTLKLSDDVGEVLTNNYCFGLKKYEDVMLGKKKKASKARLR